jgi:hypothetical protein
MILLQRVTVNEADYERNRWVGSGGTKLLWA